MGKKPITIAFTGSSIFLATTSLLAFISLNIEGNAFKLV
jgi:hypothetical protein